MVIEKEVYHFVNAGDEASLTFGSPNHPRINGLQLAQAKQELAPDVRESQVCSGWLIGCGHRLGIKPVSV